MGRTSKTKLQKSTSQQTKSGSGGLKTTPKINWLKMSLIVVVIAAAGGTLVYKSFAVTYVPACASGSRSLGTTTGYKDGKAYTIRLCEVAGFKSTGSEDSTGLVRVNSQVSQKWVNLQKAAKRDKVTLVADSSFRSMDKQKALYDCYITKKCNYGHYAAKPGYSNHQYGEAVDIDIVAGKPDPSLTTCKKYPGSYSKYKWLAQNAPWAGLTAGIADECWHWSSTGK